MSITSEKQSVDFNLTEFAARGLTSKFDSNFSRNLLMLNLKYLTANGYREFYA